MEQKGSFDSHYTVVVVDDEPMAVKAVCKIIEKHCPAFQVVDIAGNGQEAIARTKPDLVLTDIAMPLMNGLDMIRAAKKDAPDTCFVIISGYQDFSYVREAIHEGVLDYLAKPIVPSQVVPTMERVEQKLAARFYQERNRILRNLCLGKQVSLEQIQKYFHYQQFYAALLRQNGLPRRFSSEGEGELYGTMEERYSVYGRDSMEELFLIPREMMEGQSLVDYMERVGGRQKSPESYLTLLYYEKSFPASQISEKIKGLYRSLNVCSTVELTQSVNLDDRENLEAREPIPDSEELKSLIEKMDVFLKTGHQAQINQELEKLFSQWEREKRPQIWVEHACRRLLNYVRLQTEDESSLLESEYQLDEAFSYSTSMSMLMQNLHELLFRFKEEKEKPKVNSPEFFGQIEAYLKEHMADQMSLQQLADEFAISQVYMSKLFRKYAGKTYNQYLTAIRMEEAKRLMEDNPSLYVREIAECVGYHDQFYFSRIFRSYTGQMPADYLNS